MSEVAPSFNTTFDRVRQLMEDEKKTKIGACRIVAKELWEALGESKPEKNPFEPKAIRRRWNRWDGRRKQAAAQRRRAGKRASKLKANKPVYDARCLLSPVQMEGLICAILAMGANGQSPSTSQVLDYVATVNGGSRPTHAKRWIDYLINQSNGRLKIKNTKVIDAGRTIKVDMSEFPDMKAAFEGMLKKHFPTPYDVAANVREKQFLTLDEVVLRADTSHGDTRVVPVRPKDDAERQKMQQQTIGSRVKTVGSLVFVIDAQGKIVRIYAVISAKNKGNVNGEFLLKYLPEDVYKQRPELRSIKKVEKFIITQSGMLDQAAFAKLAEDLGEHWQKMNPGLRAVLLMDGCGAHWSLGSVDALTKFDIIPFCMMAGTTAGNSPLDQFWNATFRKRFKKLIYSRMHMWTFTDVSSWIVIIDTAIEALDVLTEAVGKASWRQTGWFPLDWEQMEKQLRAVTCKPDEEPVNEHDVSAAAVAACNGMLKSVTPTNSQRQRLTAVSKLKPRMMGHTVFAVHDIRKIVEASVARKAAADKKKAETAAKKAAKEAAGGKKKAAPGSKKAAAGAGGKKKAVGANVKAPAKKRKAARYADDDDDNMADVTEDNLVICEYPGCSVVYAGDNVFNKWHDAECDCEPVYSVCDSHADGLAHVEQHELQCNGNADDDIVMAPAKVKAPRRSPPQKAAVEARDEGREPSLFRLYADIGVDNVDGRRAKRAKRQ